MKPDCQLNVGSMIKIGKVEIRVTSAHPEIPNCFKGSALTNPSGKTLSKPRSVYIRLLMHEKRVIIRSNDITGTFLLQADLAALEIELVS